MSGRASALVFDFDGTILDTETPVYESWADTYLMAGAEPVTLERWLQDIGKADGSGLDIRAELCDQLGVDALSAQVEERRKSLCDEMIHAQPLREGVLRWIDAATALDIPMAIASSSSTTWVSSHLERLGLTHHFAAVSCADPGIAGKPDPAVYLSACQALNVSQDAAVAIEDSTHGVSAAIAAGMRCIAAPGPLTKTMRFDHATIHVDSLGDVDPGDWLS